MISLKFEKLHKTICPNCGFEFKPKPKRKAVESTELMEPIRDIPPPDGKKIHEYTVSMNENI